MLCDIKHMLFDVIEINDGRISVKGFQLYLQWLHHISLHGAEVDNADYSLANTYSAAYALQIATSIFFLFSKVYI